MPLAAADSPGESATENAVGEGYVYARTLRGLLDLAAALGASPETIARKAEVDITPLNMPDGVLPVAGYYRLQQEFLAQTGNPDFGLLSGRVSYMESAHLLLYLASNSQTLRDWLNMVPSVASFLGDVSAIGVSRPDVGSFTLEWRPRRPPNPERCVITDSVLSAAALQMDGYCLLPVAPTRVDLPYVRPADTSGLESAFGAPLFFEQAVSALHYPWEALDYPQLHVSTRFYDTVAEEFSTHFSNHSSATDPFSRGLHSAVRSQLPIGECSIDSVAAELNMSRRTLQRRLKNRDTNFQQLVQGVKSSLARRYLQDKSLSIIEIAFLLGYGDPSSFSAAFKSWSGLTPTEYRQG
jgi:AraC-like DNA-binding protein